MYQLPSIIIDIPPTHLYLRSSALAPNLRRQLAGGVDVDRAPVGRCRRSRPRHRDAVRLVGESTKTSLPAPPRRCRMPAAPPTRDRLEAGEAGGPGGGEVALGGAAGLALADSALNSGSTDQAMPGRRSRKGVAFSKASAIRSTVASWNGLAMSWIATGRSPAPKPAQTDIAG